MQGKKRNLQKVVIFNFAIFALALTVIISAVVSVQYTKKEMTNCSNTAYGFTKAAAEYINGNTIEGYVESKKKDDYYYGIQAFLNSYQKNSNILYYYVFVPYEDDLVYVWDADNHEGACQLGDHENYMKGGKEAIDKIYRANPPEKVTITKDEKYGYIASAYSPIFDDTGKPVAVVGVDISMPTLQREITLSLIPIIGAILLLIFLSMILFFAFAKKMIITPLNKLNQASKEMVDHLENQSTVQIDIDTGNEFEELADSFNQMSREVKDYIDRLSQITAEKERIGAELDVANRIQASMLPCIFPAFPDRKEFEVYASMDPAKEVGGDFYDFFMVDEDNLAVVVADVSGKGIPAALFMVIGKTLIKDHSTPGKDLGKVFTEVNEILCESNSEELFITAFLGVLNLKTGNFRYVNAGHEIPFIAKKNEKFKPHKVRAGFVLAGLDGIKYKADEIQLEPGDKFFQYTDGVTEATDKDNKLYGMKRLEKTLSALSDQRPTEILHEIKKDIDTFVGEAPQFDDITMLCFEYKGEEQDNGMRVEPSIDNLSKITEYAENFFEKNGVSMKTVMKMNIAIDEIYSNIVKFSGASYAKISCELKNGIAYLCFEDDGIPYNPLKKEDTDISLSAEEREIGGLGILMVKKSMDNMEYSYENGKNILKISKRAD